MSNSPSLFSSDHPIRSDIAALSDNIRWRDYAAPILDATTENRDYHFGELHDAVSKTPYSQKPDMQVMAALTWLGSSPNSPFDVSLLLKTDDEEIKIPRELHDDVLAGKTITLQGIDRPIESPAASAYILYTPKVIHAVTSKEENIDAQHAS